MRKRAVIMIAATTIVAAVTTGAGFAVANSVRDDNSTPITGTELELASAAALAHTGGGRVTQTEVGDEDSYYEVEVTFDDGKQVDVQLDRDFSVVEVMADHEGDPASQG